MYSSKSNSLTISIPQVLAVPINPRQISFNSNKAFGGSSDFIFAISYKCLSVILPATSHPKNNVQLNLESNHLI